VPVGGTRRGQHGSSRVFATLALLDRAPWVALPSSTTTVAAMTGALALSTARCSRYFRSGRPTCLLLGLRFRYLVTLPKVRHHAAAGIASGNSWASRFISTPY